MKYLLDTNIFIEAQKRYYHDQIVPSFWRWLQQDPDIYTIEAVKAEVAEQKDGLSALINNVKTIEDEAGAECMGDVSGHVIQAYPSSSFREAFLQGADIALIAVAKAKGCTIVTEEEKITKKPNTKRVKIPNVCEAIGVPFRIHIFGVLRSKNINLSSYKS